MTGCQRLKGPAKSAGPRTKFPGLSMLKSIRINSLMTRLWLVVHRCLQSESKKLPSIQVPALRGAGTRRGSESAQGPTPDSRSPGIITSKTDPKVLLPLGVLHVLMLH